jgi:hypothetical protein
MTSKLPTDPLADASTGVVRRSRGAFLKTVPDRKRDRRNPTRESNYTGPERRKEPQSAEPGAEAKETKRIFGQPRWLVIAAAVYVVALAIAMVLVFTY